MESVIRTSIRPSRQPRQWGVSLHFINIAATDHFKMMNIAVFAWLFVFLIGAVLTQPLFGLEKQLLYSFQDPDEFEIINKRAPLLNLVGSNVRFTEPFRNRILNKKKIRSVKTDDPVLLPCTKNECPQLYK